VLTDVVDALEQWSANAHAPSFVCCRDFFYQFGQLESIRIVERQACAFVTYASRADAEMVCAARNVASTFC
jgi:hypothetical protein